MPGVSVLQVDRLIIWTGRLPFLLREADDLFPGQVFHDCRPPTSSNAVVSASTFSKSLL
jgi:hypothetical protein